MNRVVSVLVCMACMALNAEDVKPVPVSEEKLKSLIAQLGDADFEKRDAAEKELIKSGAAARKALESAQQSKDAQVKASAKRILSKIDDDSQLDERHVEKDGKFSFQPPKDWAVREFPGFKYKICAGPASDAFAPNINVVDEAFAGGLDDYVKANKETLEKLLPDYKVVTEGKVTLNSGDEAARLIITDSQMKKQLRQSFYFVKGTGGKMFVITCTALAEKGADLDATFERSLKTFRNEKE